MADCPQHHCGAWVAGVSQCSAPGTRICSGCKVVRYCSKECQLAHWKWPQDSHKVQCKNLATVSEAREGFILDRTRVAKLRAGGQKLYPGLFASDDLNPAYDLAPWDEAIRWEAETAPGVWVRYQRAMEHDMERLRELGASKLIYRPGNKEALGNFIDVTDEQLAQIRSSEDPLACVAAEVGTHYVMLNEETEIEFFTGVTRNVRRTGPPTRDVGMSDVAFDPRFVGLEAPAPPEAH